MNGDSCSGNLLYVSKNQKSMLAPSIATKINWAYNNSYW
jgi:hypothetical protein